MEINNLAVTVKLYRVNLGNVCIYQKAKYIKSEKRLSILQ